jgi:hypothetical protein
VAAFVLLTTLLASPTVQAAEDPPMVRGDQRNGEVATDLTWSDVYRRCTVARVLRWGVNRRTSRRCAA